MEEYDEARQVNAEADSILRAATDWNNVYPPFHINLGVVNLLQYRIEKQIGSSFDRQDFYLDEAESALKHAIIISNESGDSPSPHLGAAYYNLACVESLRNIPVSLRRSINLLVKAGEANGFDFCEVQRTDGDLINAFRRERELYREMLLVCDCAREPDLSTQVATVVGDKVGFWYERDNTAGSPSFSQLSAIR
jgi:hypothetical protein